MNTSAMDSSVTKFIVATLLTCTWVTANASSAPPPQGLLQVVERTIHKANTDLALPGYAFSAGNPRHNLNFYFGDKGLLTRPPHAPADAPAWEFNMALTAYGQPGAMVPVAAPITTVQGQRVTLQRGAVEEWYVNDQRGLEQGFNVTQPANFDPQHPLVLSLKLSGNLVPSWHEYGQALVFSTPEGVHAFDYDHLHVFDANGQSLPAELALTEQTLEIRVAATSAAWPVTVDPLFSTQSELVANDGALDDRFGFAVALDGDTALVGSFRDDDSGLDSGSAYVFIRDSFTGIWSDQDKLLADDGAVEDLFGIAVALDGDTALIGAVQDDNNGTNNTGSAYVFTRDSMSGLWSQQGKLTDSNAAVGDRLGISVALVDDTALVGAARADGTGGVDSGSAYVFTRSGSSWTEQSMLTASNAAADDRFGRSVALYGDTALVGAPQTVNGSAYVFTRTASTWTEQDILTASNAATDDRFGRSVALFDDTALVGAPEADGTGGVDSGSAYVFTGSGSNWTEQNILTASDAAAGDLFGAGVALEGDTALVGAYKETTPRRGSVYVFVGSGAGWSEQDKITNGDGTNYVIIGNAEALALSGDTVLTGAIPDFVQSVNGKAFLFRFNCSFGSGVPDSLWTMVSLPCDLGNASTVADVFGDNLDILQYAVRWVVYRVDADGNSVIMALANDMLPGQGYWLKSLDAGTWDAGDGALFTYTTGNGCTSTKGCIEVGLVSVPDPAQPGDYRFTMVGSPSNIPTNWADVRILVDDVPFTPSDAEANSFVSKTIYRWNGASYDTYDDTTFGMEGVLEDQLGYYVKALSGSAGTTLKLLIPYGKSDNLASVSSSQIQQVPIVRAWYAAVLDFLITPAYAAKNNKAQGWSISLEVTSGSAKDGDNAFGQLLGSLDERDSHDLPAYAPFDDYLTLVFPRPEWPMNDDAETGDYASDYHAFKSKAADEWYFQVRSRDPDRQVTLSWSALQMLEGTFSDKNGRYTWAPSDMDPGSLMSKMWLEDVDTGELFEAYNNRDIGAYSFNMNGQGVRTFRWVQEGKKTGNDKEDKRDKALQLKNWGEEKNKANKKRQPPGLL